MQLLLELLKMGVYIQFDTLGRVGAAVARYPYIHDPDMNRVYQSAGDVLVAEAIPQLIEAGYEDRILLSQDVCTKIHLKAYGGTGYSLGIIYNPVQRPPQPTVPLTDGRARPGYRSLA